MRKFTMVGLGELLWDVFPTHKQLGGAPANFAYISSLLGDSAFVVSRVGRDPLGEEATARLQTLQLDTSYLQFDVVHATGTVNVEVAPDGQPQFEITKDVAWDFLESTSSLADLAGKTDAVCFGSLAQRGIHSRETIARFLDSTPENALIVFDVNLRQSFYSSKIIEESAKRADILKLNHEELPVVVQALGGQQVSELASAQWLCRRFDLKVVCVTRGSAGSLLVTENGSDEHPGHPVAVVDTVGAGDAFTAALVHHHLRGSTLGEMNDAANRMGAWVASQRGATPPADIELLSQVRTHH